MSEDSPNRESRSGAATGGGKPSDKSTVYVVLSGFLDFFQDIQKVLTHSIHALTEMEAAPVALEELRAVEGLNLPELRPRPIVQEHIDDARAAAEWNRDQRFKGHPLLHAQFVIVLWGALEALIEDLTVAILVDGGASVLDSEARVRIPVRDLLQLGATDRATLVVREVRRATDADLREGVSRFEVLLRVVGMSGPVDDDLRRDMFEMSKVRNVLVHRRGIVDRDLLTSCPWLGLSEREELRVSDAMAQRYGNAATEYFKLLVGREKRRRESTPVPSE
jgi:hypothetical protein